MGCCIDSSSVALVSEGGTASYYSTAVDSDMRHGMHSYQRDVHTT